MHIKINGKLEDLDSPPIIIAICQLNGANPMKPQPHRKKHRQCKKLERRRAQRRGHQLVVKCQMFY